MIAKLLATTAVVLALGTGAYAANTNTDANAPAASATTAAPGVAYTVASTDAIASKIIGAKVYDNTGQNAQEIGTIKDLVLDQAGKITAAVIGVGGFLGVGEKNVAIDYAQIKWQPAANGGGTVPVLSTTKEALNAAPAFQYPDTANNQAANNATVQNNNSAATTTTAMAPANNAAKDNSSLTSNSGAATATNANAEVDPSTLKAVDVASMKSDDLKGIDVINSTGEKLGSINDFVLTKDGKTVDAVIVDFGGFLGIGTKQVALGYDHLKFMTDQNNKRYLEVDLTKDQLDKQQAYNKDTYATDRDQQRMTVNS